MRQINWQSHHCLLGGVQIKFHIILLFCGFESWFSHPMVAMVVFLLPVAAASAAHDAGDQAEQPPEHKTHICQFLHNRNLRPGNFTLKKVRKLATKL